MNKMEFWKVRGGSSMLMGWLGEHVFVCGVGWEMGVGRAEGEASRGNCLPPIQTGSGVMACGRGQQG